MNSDDDRVHRALDGELSLEELTSAERRRFVSLSATLAEAASVVRAQAAPDLTARVMNALPRDTRSARSVGSRFTAALAWLWEPRPLSLSLRPAYGAIAIVAIALGISTLSGGDLPEAEVAAAPAAAEPPVVYVQFRLDVPGAATVEVAGSFTNWTSGVPLVETAPGVWSTLVALEPGVHDYTFIVDGERWVVDPTAPAVDDGFGGTNSRLFLTRPGGNA